MIIDCHTHIGRNHHIDANVDQLLRSMDQVGIDKSLVFAGEMNDAPNEWMIDQIAPHRDRLLGVAAANPMSFTKMDEIQDEADQIVDWYGEGKIVACKFYTGYDHYYPQDKVIEEYLMSFEPVGLPAIFHSGDCLNSVKHAKLKFAHPLHIDEVAVDYPNMKFIIAHMGYPWQRDAAEVCYKNQNVFADISGFVYGSFDSADLDKFKKTIIEFVEIAGEKKLLFGTDWPISNQTSYLDAKKHLSFDELFIEAKEIFRID